MSSVDSSEIFVDREAADEYLCILCLDVMNRPAQVGCGGGHIFCLSCINELLNKSQFAVCPICRTEFPTNSIVEIPYIQRKIDDLAIICSNHYSISDTNTELQSISNNNEHNTNTLRDNLNLANAIINAIVAANVACTRAADADTVMKDTENVQNIQHNINGMNINNNQENTQNESANIRNNNHNNEPHQHNEQSDINHIEAINKENEIQQSGLCGKKRKISELKQDKDEDEDDDIIILNEPNIKRQKLGDTLDTECCQWSGRYGDLEKHLKECPLEYTKCVYSTVGCKQKVLRKDMTLHCNECDYFPVQCSQCVAKISRGYLWKHIADDCVMAMVKCVDCTMELQRKALYKHRKEECGESRIDCEYSKYGCNWIKRKDEATHYQEYMEHHLKLVKESHSKLEQKVVRITKRLDSLVYMVGSLGTRVNDLQDEVY